MGKRASRARSSTTFHRPSVVDTLQQLREFCPSFSEADLSGCLSQSGYNVELAAERLLTGVYKPTTPSPRAIINPVNNHSNNVTSTPKSSDAAPLEIVTPQSVHSSKKAPTTSSKRPPPSPNAQQQQQPKVAKKARFISPKTPRLSKKQSNDDVAVRDPSALLLCQRWLVGTCTTKNAKTSYKESLHISHYSTGTGSANLVRFRGEYVEGNLPRSLAFMLTPLLRHTPNNLITLHAEALMDDGGLQIGSEVPLSLSVYLSSTVAFFDIFNHGAADLSSSQFFGKTPAKKPKLPISEAAFSLLQWAEYGELPEDPEFLRKSERMDDDDDDTEEPALSAECAKSVTDVSSRSALPQADDPLGFVNNNIQLKPYQRQALFWMLGRENHGAMREELEKQFALLAELAKQKKPIRPSSSPSSSEDIKCECGPVVVSEEAAKRSKTIHGEVDPLKHPLWQRRFLAKHGMQEAISFYVNEFFGIAMTQPPPPPQQCSGGILADSMGLGKTVMLLALILKSKEHAQANGREDTSTGQTLVIAPLSLVGQWEEEIETKTNLSYHVHYGEKAKGVGSVNEDVVLTTYDTLKSELSNKELSGIFDRRWLRVILDEAHFVKNPATLSSTACCLLESEYRWCVTGTIIHNSLDDAFALLKFLRHQPWCEPAFWKRAISSVMRENDETNASAAPVSGLQLAMGRVKRLLAPLMIRRTKDSVGPDGKPILTLPPVETKTIQVELSDSEREFYDALLFKSKTVFEGFINRGTANKSWFAIFSLIQRLRQTCDHVALTVKSRMDESDWQSSCQTTLDSGEPASDEEIVNEGVDNKFLLELLDKFQGNSARLPRKLQEFSLSVAKSISERVKNDATHMEDECPICLENPEVSNAVVTPCAHIFCRPCLENFLKENSTNGTECPVCHKTLKANRIIALSKSDGVTTTSYLSDRKKSPHVNRHHQQKEMRTQNRNVAARATLQNALDGASSSKLSAVMDELQKIWEVDPNSKVVIFSQFLGFLDLLARSCKEREIHFNRFDGQMSLKERIKVLDDFKNYSSTHSEQDDTASVDKRQGSVLLASMKSGGVGLNLVAAHSVFIVDPWWNAGVEDQCINRIHRIGQLADTVRVRKFIVNNSVEEKIADLQSKKRKMASEVLSDFAEGTNLSDSRPTLDDFKVIFGCPSDK